MALEVEQTLAALGRVRPLPRGEDHRQSLAFLVAALRAFWAFHHEGARDLAARVLDWAADEEFATTDDCRLSGELSTRLGYDNDNSRERTRSRVERAALLQALLNEYPLG